MSKRITQICLGVALILGVVAVYQIGRDALKREADREIEAFINGYFSSWSALDMASYGKCFHPDAVIYFKDQTQHVHASALDPFIQSQEAAHRQSPERMREVPTSIRMMREGALAQVTARWRLTHGRTEKVGTDCFTLTRTPEGWRILSLVFESDASKQE